MSRALVVAVGLLSSLSYAQVEELENPGSVSAIQDRAYRMQHELNLAVGVLPLDASDEYGALDRGADLVIGTRPPSATFARTRVAALPVNAYVPAGHALAGRTQVALAELAQFDLLVPTADSHARRALDAAVESGGLAVRTLEFSSSQVAQAVAAAGRGVAVVSDDPRFGLVPLTIHTASGDVLRIALHAAWQPHHHGAAQLAEVARRLKAFVGERYRPEV